MKQRTTSSARLQQFSRSSSPTNLNCTKQNSTRVFLEKKNKIEMEQQQSLLSDNVMIDGTVYSAPLFSDGKLRWSEDGKKCLTIEKEVLGVTVEGSKIKIKAVVDGGDGPCCVGTSRKLVRKDFIFEPLSDDSRVLWSQKLRDHIDSLGRPRRLFVFVNPFGGKRSASKIFSDDVKPLFDDADIQLTIQETKHQLYAKEVVQGLDLTKYDGIVCVSGDGILVEVVNGLLEREDWKAAIKMPVGLVPAGTGNGMVKSLLDSVGEPCSPFNATIAIIRGHQRKLDVATITQKETRFFSVLMLAWGLVADIDIESEKYRWMGSSRLDFYALQRIVHLRKYNGSISFVPAPGYEIHGEPCIDRGEATSEGEPSKIQPQCYQGPCIHFKNSEWRFINGPFVSIWLHNVPWGSEDSMAAPDAKFSDGYLDLIIIGDCPKLGLLSLMTNLNNGGHVKSPYVTYLKVKAFILEPGKRTDDPSKEGIIDSDGEVLVRGKGTYKCEQKSLMAYEKLQIDIDQGLATLFAPI